MGVLCSSLTSLALAPAPPALPLQAWGGCVAFDESKMVLSLCFLSFQPAAFLVLAREQVGRENKFLLGNFGNVPIGVSGLQAFSASRFGCMRQN